MQSFILLTSKKLLLLLLAYMVRKISYLNLVTMLLVLSSEFIYSATAFLPINPGFENESVQFCVLICDVKPKAPWPDAAVDVHYPVLLWAEFVRREVCPVELDSATVEADCPTTYGPGAYYRI